jgi:hypothetical protein
MRLALNSNVLHQRIEKKGAYLMSFIQNVLNSLQYAIDNK